jgi:MFS superfamily sulfate permease-like transporter
LYNHFFHFIPLFVLAGIVFIWFIGIFKLYRRRMSG